jgi:hypothetical protein
MNMAAHRSSAILHKCNPARNQFRLYNLAVQPNLFRRLVTHPGMGPHRQPRQGAQSIVGAVVVGK